MATCIIGLLIPLLGTMLGSAFVFFIKQDMPDRLQKALLGFASGVMVAASVWSLLIPAIEAESAKAVGVVLAGATQGTAELSTIGFAIGFVLMMILDVVLG